MAIVNWYAPANLEAEPVAFLHEAAHVWKFLVDDRVALGVVLRAMDALTTSLPALIDSCGRITGLEQRDVRFVVHSP